MVTAWEGSLAAKVAHGADSEETMTLEEALVVVWEGQAPRKTIRGANDAPRKSDRGANSASRKTIRDTKIVLRGIEQNPKTESRWAQLARAGHKVMQFLSAGRYIGNVVDGKVTIYGGKKNTGTTMQEPGEPVEGAKDLKVKGRKKDEAQRRKGQ